MLPFRAIVPRRAAAADYKLVICAVTAL